MNDYIKREDAINARNEYLNETVEKDSEEQTAHDRAYAEGWNACNYEYLGNIKELPSADVVPVRHGHWIHVDDVHDVSGMYKGSVWKCSECGYSFERLIGCGISMKMCHDCGARMDEGEEQWMTLSRENTF